MAISCFNCSKLKNAGYLRITSRSFQKLSHGFFEIFDILKVGWDINWNIFLDFCQFSKILHLKLLLEKKKISH